MAHNIASSHLTKSIAVTTAGSSGSNPSARIASRSISSIPGWTQAGQYRFPRDPGEDGEALSAHPRRRSPPDRRPVGPVAETLSCCRSNHGVHRWSRTERGEGNEGKGGRGGFSKSPLTAPGHIPDILVRETAPPARTGAPPARTGAAPWPRTACCTNRCSAALALGNLTIAL
jgi:hypothetical protein